MFLPRKGGLVGLMIVAVLSLGLAAPATPRDTTAATTAYVTVKRGVKRTTIRLSGSGGSITRVAAVERTRTVAFQRVRTGATSLLSCPVESQMLVTAAARREEVDGLRLPARKREDFINGRERQANC